MIRIKLPIQNTVEVVIADIRVECSIRVDPMVEPHSVEARIVLDAFKSRLNELAGKFSHEIVRKVESELNPLTT